MSVDDRIHYELSYETRGGRCAWCWKLLPEHDTHAVVRAAGLELRFHHNCWPLYRSLSGVEGQELRSLYREWPVQRVESLRLHLSLTVEEFAARLRITKDRFTQVMSGRAKLGQKVVARLRELAVDNYFERQEERQIDWGDRRAVFCLCLHNGWNCGDLAKKLGVRDNTVSAWWDRGVPRQSTRHRGRLSQLARQTHFDAGMLVDDYLWTAELARAAVTGSGMTQAAWAEASGCHPSLIRDALRGQRRVNRQMAYYLTRAAIAFGRRLPLAGQIAGKKRASRLYQRKDNRPGGDEKPN